MNKYALLLAAVGLALPFTASADFTHLNVDHREMVNLRMEFNVDSTECTSSAFRNDALKLVLPTGKLANNEFSVPAGKELVITDVSWAISRSSGTWDGGNIRPRLIARIAGEAGSPPFNNGIVSLPAIKLPTSGNEIVFGTSQLTAGVRVAARRFICATTPGLINAGTTTQATSFRELEIYGYLVDKRL